MAQSPDFQTWAENINQEKHQPAPKMTWWQRWSLKRKLLLIGVIIMVVIAIAAGVGVGLAKGGSSSDADSDQRPSPTSRDTADSEGLWKPTAGTTWNYKLLNTVDESVAASAGDIEVFDIDLFNNDDQVISSLQSANKKVLCYFSAGTFEDWRSDKDDFEGADMGDALPEWEGEKWLDTNSANVRQVMCSRLDMAVEKKCNGVEPDNVDAYDNENGLDLSESDASDYVTFLANEAHSRNLSMALKNAGSIVSAVIDVVEYSVQEQCLEYDNCNQFMPFIEANKPVFHVEYPKGDETNDESISTEEESSICGSSATDGFSTIIKNMELDEWVEPCPSRSPSRQ